MYPSLSLSLSLLTLGQALRPIAAVATETMEIRNGQVNSTMKNVVTKLGLDSGWFKFFFGQSDEETAYTFEFHHDDYIQISITDAYCVGDSFDLYKNGSYLLTTPRVHTDGCRVWTDDPDVAFVNPAYSSTKFMLPGKFRLTLWSHDSPYQGGAAFIRADSYLETCSNSVHPFILVTSPKVSHSDMASVCKRVGGVPAKLGPNSFGAAADTMRRCNQKLAWFGHVSLLPRTKSRRSLGCLAYSTEVPDDPTVEIVDCKTRLPTLCMVV